MKRSVLALLTIIISASAFSQGINWMTWEEAMVNQSQEEKVVFVDVYTNWCGWCKKMDQTTFRNQDIVEYMNKNYYAVKFNAEQKDTIMFNNQEFINQGKGRRSSHQLAVALLDGKMSYPSYAFIGQPWNKTVAPGYMKAKDFSCVLKYFVEGASVGKTYDKFRQDGGCAVASTN